MTNATCTGTLVLHGDGTRECELGASCTGDLLEHDWVVFEEMQAA